MPTPKIVEKPLPRTGKRNGHEVDPSDSRGGQTGGERGGRGGRGRGGYGNEAGRLFSARYVDCGLSIIFANHC